MPEETTSTSDSKPIAEEKRESRAEMSFLDHLEDLRGTLIRCIIAFLVGCFIVMAFMKYFADLLNWPLQFALGDNVELVEHAPIYTGLGGASEFPHP